MSVLESEQRANENEFDSLPHWLENISKTSTLLLWLPVNVSHLKKAATFELAKKSRSKELVSKNEKIKHLLESEDITNSPPPLLPQSSQKVAALKAELMAIDCTADFLHLADKIRRLCLE
ncbi:hypothetical protein MA16_Dca009096 [Dendrobium catenatum]|uniref:Uncharacterized protein n=1 Tax=Dendrobium catenatum TaxID=906689 RepID=A0A2I0VRI9_9ASPA|nr:hypothetical protein MA16_Dca009096 [Dendrobium catenatum]